MEALDRRKDRRLDYQFPAKLNSRLGLGLSVEGTTENVSQCGALIRSKNRHAFKVYDPAVLTFFLPPDFTGHNKTIELQGETVITRIDHAKAGIAVEFIKTFKEFERIDVSDLHKKSGNRIA